MMGRRGFSVCNLLGRPSVLLLILLPILLTEGIDVEVYAAGDEKAEFPILSTEDVGDGSPMREEEEEETKTRKQKSGTRVRSRDRKRGRVAEGDKMNPVEVEQGEATQRMSSEGTTEEQRSGTRSNNRDGEREWVDEGDRKEQAAQRGNTEERVEEQQSDKELRRLLRHNRELLDLLINNTYREHNSNLSSSEITFPKCGVGEYASIPRSISRLGASLIRELKLYVNQHGEFRFFFCKPCRVCHPDAYEIFPCLTKSDTVCARYSTGVRCKHDNMVFYPHTGCVPLSSPELVMTKPVHTTTQTTVTNPADSVNLKLEEGNTSLPHEGPPWASLTTTIIAVGVLSLNVLVFTVLIFVAKRKKRSRCSRKVASQHPCCESINNLSSTQIGGTPSPRHHRHGEQSLPSISSQVNKRPTTVAPDLSSRAVEMGSLSPYDSYSAAHSEVSLVQVNRAKESNLNIFNEPSYERGAQVVSIPLLEDLDSANSIQVLRGKDPFWLVMIGRFGPEGGILCCEDSDFILEIPPGAIPPDRRDQLIIARISLCPDSIGPMLTDPDSLWLGPLVELESPGLDRFHKNVKIRLPHRARLQPGWTFSVHYTDPTADTKCNCQTDTAPSTVDQDPEAATFLLDEDTDTKPKWNCVEQKWHSGIKEEKASKDVTRVTFTVDEKYVNILSSHFSEYVCSGCSKTHPLNLEAVVFWQHYKVEGLDQMDLKVYIIDIIKDTRKVRVESNERSSKQVGAKSGMTAYSPLSLEYTSGVASSLAIFVDEECMDDWKWMIKSYNGRLPVKRVMSVESVIRGCCSSHLSTREMFTFVPRDPSKQLSFFQAMVCISQPNSPEGDLTPILVTVPLTKGYAVNNNNKVCSEGQPIGDDQMDFVGERLPCSKWPTLYRKLMGKGADNGIEEIKLKHPNNPREQIQSALVSWRSSKGRMATVEKLITALQQAKLEDCADELLSYCQDYAEEAEEVSTPTDTRLVMETHL